jgi:bifunctional DNA-binding transcriptional regulator/antitoxin component of YhaV-PrlF toxin-antitoxin module
MKMTSKRQVTIPQDIRERIRLLPDTEVEFDVVGNAVKIRQPRNSRARARAGGPVEGACQSNDDDGRDHGADARVSMPPVLADSNVILDIATEDEQWLEWQIAEEAI